MLFSATKGAESCCFHFSESVVFNPFRMLMGNVMNLSPFRAFMEKHGLTEAVMLELLAKYHSIHACKCSTAMCTGHNMCHG